MTKIITFKLDYPLLVVHPSEPGPALHSIVSHQKWYNIWNNKNTWFYIRELNLHLILYYVPTWSSFEFEGENSCLFTCRYSIAHLKSLATSSHPSCNKTFQSTEQSSGKIDRVQLVDPLKSSKIILSDEYHQVDSSNKDVNIPDPVILQGSRIWCQSWNN